MPALRCAAAALAAALLLPGAAAAKPPVWIVRSGSAELVLFGSIHLLPAGLDWRPQALDRALKTADELWFEIPIDQASAVDAARLAQQRGVLPQGDSLLARLSAKGALRLARLARSLGLPLAALDRMRPWRAEVVISLAEDAAHGALASQGVERQIAALVPAGVRRRAFETARQQIGFLSGLPMAAQIASLEQTLAEEESQPGLYQAIVRDWMAADLPRLQGEALDPVRIQTPLAYRRLILDRNRRWVRVLTHRLRGRGEAVVIVGMDHLIGADGLIAALRRRGFAVEGP